MSLSFLGGLAISLAVSTIMILIIKDLFIDQKSFWRWYKRELSDQDRKREEYLANFWGVPLAQVQIAIRNLNLLDEFPERDEYDLPDLEGWSRFEFLKWYKQRSAEINGRGVDAIFSSNLRRLRRIGRRIKTIVLFKK